MLGGRAGEVAEPPAPPPYPAPYGPPPGVPPEIPPWAQPQPQHQPYAYAPAQAPPAFAPAPPPPAHAPVPPAPYGTPNGPADEDDGLTRFMQGPDLAKLKIPTTLYTLQILDRNGQWQPWSTIGTGGLKVGRTERSSQFPELNSMAVKHLKLSYDGTRLLAEDQGTLNGVYLRLVEPVELKDGARFRVGGLVLEFHLAEPPTPAPIQRSDDGEEFWCGDLVPRAFLDFLRPDGTRGVRVPLTHPEPTILGRGSRPGKPVTLPLPADDWVSGQHAQVRPDGEGRYFLDDLHSRNGTFLRTEGPTPVKAGDVLLCGRVLLRVADSSGR